MKLKWNYSRSSQVACGVLAVGLMAAASAGLYQVLSHELNN